MTIFRSKPLLIAMFLLAGMLQILTPFLHAHTGASSKAGLHMHVAATGFESAVASEAGNLLLTNASDESPEVGVPASRQGDEFNLIDFNIYAFVLFALVYGSSKILRISFFCSSDRFAYQRYAQSSPPLSLAPPQYL